MSVPYFLTVEIFIFSWQKKILGIVLSLPPKLLFVAIAKSITYYSSEIDNALTKLSLILEIQTKSLNASDKW